MKKALWGFLGICLLCSFLIVYTIGIKSASVFYEKFRGFLQSRSFEFV